MSTTRTFESMDFSTWEAHVRYQEQLAVYVRTLLTCTEVVHRALVAKCVHHLGSLDFTCDVIMLNGEGARWHFANGTDHLYLTLGGGQREPNALTWLTISERARQSGTVAVDSNFILPTEVLAVIKKMYL